MAEPSLSSMSSRPSERFISEAERREKLKKEQALRDFYVKNDSVYVGERSFNQSWATIKGWINIPSLMGHLMRNGLVNDADDMEAISSPYLPAAQKHTNLKRLLDSNGGGCGHFIFYMSLCESLESNPLGHGDAVDEMQKQAKIIEEKAPWLNKGEPPSLSPSSSSSSFLSTDTSSEMGPQSLLSMSSQATPTGLSTMTSGMSSLSLSSRDIAANNRESCATLTSSGQQGVQPSQNSSSGSPSGQCQVSNTNPLNQPKLEPAGTPTPCSVQNVATPTCVSGRKDVYNLENSKGGAGVVQPGGTASIYQSSGTNMHPLNKDYMSGECSSYPVDSHSFPHPIQEAHHWTSRTDSMDSTDTERDGVRQVTQQKGIKDKGGVIQLVKADSASSGAVGMDTSASISLDEIQDMVVNGDIENLTNNYDNSIDFQCTTETGNTSDFMDEVCRFACAVLNSRDSNKIGVLLGGVSEPEDHQDKYGVEGVNFEPTGRQTIEQQYERRLSTVLCAQGDDRGSKLTTEELKLVQLKFVDVKHSKEDRHCSVALVTVAPDYKVCRSRVYMCQFRDSGGRAVCQCYKRLEGESVHIRQQKKITGLKQVLNNYYK